MEPRNVFGPTGRSASAFARTVLLSSALIVASVGCDAGREGVIDSMTGAAGTSGEETLEARCTATCQKMSVVSFPTALCEDAGARTHDAYFCQSIYWSPCLDSCMTAVAEAPTEACRESWEPLMTCIAGSNSYTSLLFSQPSFGKCRSHINSVAQACWGHGLDP
jgi:hypothetical protein